MRDSIVQLAQRRPQAQHSGLILQRYLTKAVTGDNGDPAERRALLEAAIKAGQSESLLAIYADAFSRWNDSFPRDNMNVTEELSAPGRLIVGLGSENVLETGICLHHTYGVPLIPGSALKGLASHYCHEVWGQRFVESPEETNRLFRRDECYHSLLFGTTEGGGIITFHDAWITPASLREGSLRLDVMTPHHVKWQTNEAPPTDFDSPVPVSFLSVAGSFQVRLSWCGPIETPQEKALAWTGLVLTLLKEALAEWGAGGKTSSGYGRLAASDRRAPIQAGESVPKISVKDKRREPATAAKRQPGSKVKVKVLEKHASIKGTFFVQEPDQPKRGLLSGDKAPAEDKLPEIGAEIEVYINSLGPPPQYRWTPLIVQPSKRDHKHKDRR